MNVVRFGLAVLVAAAVCLPFPAAAQEPANPTPPSEDAAEKAEKERQARFERFENLLGGVKLVGHFTILGKEQDELPKEEYTIKSVKKLPSGDYWLFQARIKYGKRDVTVPLPIEVKWAGDTPVITLTDFTIPGLGTFSARVVFSKNKYAGTWTHGDVGGHMFGVVEKIEKADDS